MNSIEGKLLVAAPHMLNPNFSHTVVLVLHHNEDGAFGVVLNRPVERQIRELMNKVSRHPCEQQDVPINLGGPLPSRLIAIHEDQSLGEMEGPPGIFLAARKKHLKRLVSQTAHRYRLFIGHAGWGPGQLEDELSRGDWLTLPASSQHIFLDHSGLWPKLLRQVGRSIVQSTLKIKNVPKDVSAN